MILLDTGVWFRRYHGIPQAKKLEDRLDTAGETFALCSVSIWEIATKQRRGKLPGVPLIEHWIQDALAGYAVLPLSPKAAFSAGVDAWEHQDPADRFIVATAGELKLELLHSDEKMKTLKTIRQTYYPAPVQA